MTARLAYQMPIRHRVHAVDHDSWRILSNELSIGTECVAWVRSALTNTSDDAAWVLSYLARRTERAAGRVRTYLPCSVLESTRLGDGAIVELRADSYDLL